MVNLQATDNLSVTNLNFSAGTITGSGALTVTGQLNWTGGTMSGTGSLTSTGTPVAQRSWQHYAQRLDLEQQRHRHLERRPACYQ